MLVRMRRDRERGKRNNWLLIKHRDGHGGKGRIPPRRRASVASGRTMERSGWQGPSPKPFMWADEGAAPDAVWHSKPEVTQAKPSPLLGWHEDFEPPRSRSPRRCRNSSTPTLQGRSAARRRDNWVHEIKFDGYRMQLRLPAARPSCEPARGSTGPKFPPIARRRSLPDCIIDGEVVALDHEGVPDFAAYRPHCQRGTRELIYFVFDLLFEGRGPARASAYERKHVPAY